MSETAFTPPICARLEARVPDFGRMLVYKQEPVQRLVNPHGPEASAIIKALAEHIAEQINFAETRIQDGKEMGATVWRIALEDIVRENRAALTKAGQ